MNIIPFFAIISQEIGETQTYNVNIRRFGGANMGKNRLIGSYPVIGIRPTIDGRRGYLNVRETLEEQTMKMARAAAELF